VVDETLRACEAAGASGRVFNGGTGARITLNQVINLLAKITAREIRPAYEPQRVGDIRDSQAEISLARKVLGWEPGVLFEEGLRRTWEWYSRAYGAKQ
jgi:UDP-glucose 4-epimerase